METDEFLFFFFQECALIISFGALTFLLIKLFLLKKHLKKSKEMTPLVINLLFLLGIAEIISISN